MHQGTFFKLVTIQEFGRNYEILRELKKLLSNVPFRYCDDFTFFNLTV